MRTGGAGSLIKGMDVEPPANEIGNDICWRSENVRTRSGFRARILSMLAEVKAPHARLLAAGLRWAHDVTGDADNVVLLAEQIQGSGGLFCEADHSARRKTWAPRSRSAQRRKSLLQALQELRVLA